MMIIVIGHTTVKVLPNITYKVVPLPRSLPYTRSNREHSITNRKTSIHKPTQQTMASTTDKLKDKLNIGSGSGSTETTTKKVHKKRHEKGDDGSSTSSSSEDERGNKLNEAERQERKKRHAAKRERRAKKAEALKK